MIINSERVEVCGLLPQFIGELVPAQTVIAACIVERSEERHEVENGQFHHNENLAGIESSAQARPARDQILPQPHPQHPASKWGVERPTEFALALSDLAENHWVDRKKGILMKISTLITGKAVYTITAETSIAVLVEKLVSLKVGALVVSPDGILISGIVSERDIVAALPIHFHELGRLRVRDIMTVNVTTCTPQSSVADLMTMMTERRIRHVPVVNAAGELISIISIGDIVKSHVSELDSERIALVDYVQNPR